jgi:ubiquinone/menaquinone biosynthesis C-methylase UbiE
MGKGGSMKSLIDKYVKFIRERRETSPMTFFTMFDGGTSFDDAKNQAGRYFDRLFLPFAKKYLGDLSDKRSLDIGYGSAFQVLRAAQYFECSYGIDIHKESLFILDTFRTKGIQKGISLSEGLADNLSEFDNDIDFVHSWVTFLHFPSIEYTNLVLKEIFRVIRPNGVAVIYYSRLVKTKRKETFKEYEADMKLEEKHLTGFEERGSLTQVFKKGIGIARWKMTQLVTNIGFELLEYTSSNDGGFVYGQHGIVLRKPPVVEPNDLLEELDGPPADVQAPPKKKFIRRRKSTKS